MDPLWHLNYRVSILKMHALALFCAKPALA